MKLDIFTTAGISLILEQFVSFPKYFQWIFCYSELAVGCKEYIAGNS